MTSKKTPNRTNNSPSDSTDEQLALMAEELGLTVEELKEIRRESSMRHPIEPGPIICDDCLNRIGGGCDYVDMGDMTDSELLEIMSTGKCDLYIKKRS